jgi:DNA ligase-1
MNFPGCQLAGDYTVWPKGVEQMALEPKFDGYRLTAMVGTDKVTFHCRETAEVEWAPNLSHIADELLAMGFQNVMIDGEVMAEDDGSGGTFNATGMVRRKHVRSDFEKNQMEKLIKFYVFDLIDPALMVDKAYRKTIVRMDPTPFMERRAQLAAKFIGVSPFSVKLAEQFIVESHAEAHAIKDRFMAKGGEGAVLKTLNSAYYTTRTDEWLKIKPFVTMEAQITGVVEGTGKYKGMMGAIHCVDKDGTAVSVGTGFDDAQRTTFWLTRTELPGKILEMKKQAGTSAKATARHPVFIRMRPDRTAL